MRIQPKNPDSFEEIEEKLRELIERQDALQKKMVQEARNLLAVLDRQIYLDIKLGNSWWYIKQRHGVSKKQAKQIYKEQEEKRKTDGFRQFWFPSRRRRGA